MSDLDPALELSFGNAFEVLPSTEEKDKSKIQFAKEVINYAFANRNHRTIADIAGYIGDRFNQNYGKKEWNCSVCELNKGAVSYFSTTNISIIYFNCIKSSYGRINNSAFAFLFIYYKYL